MLSGRPEAAAGNLTALIDSVITPNAMYHLEAHMHSCDIAD
jgi:hypothetical protein